MFTIKHKGFTISAVVSLIILLVVVTLYDCYLLNQPDNIHVRFVLKPIPVSIMILNVFVYFAIYRMHVYAILISGALLFCLLGDILLMFYVPSILEYDNITDDHGLVEVNGSESPFSIAASDFETITLDPVYDDIESVTIRSIECGDFQVLDTRTKTYISGL